MRPLSLSPSLSPLTPPAWDDLLEASNPFPSPLLFPSSPRPPSPQSIMALARQGNPVAIATLLNYALRRSQVKARVQQRHQELHILLESPHSPTLDWAVGWLGNGINYLHPALIKQIVVYGRATGERAARWQRELNLNSTGSCENVSREASEAASSGLPLTEAHLSEAAPLRTADAESAATAAPPHSSDAVMVQSLERSETSDWLKRPEALVLLIFVSLLVFWDTYVSLLEEVTDDALTSRQLAQRLGTSRKVIRRQKQQPDFAAWTQQRDPDGKAWIYKNGIGFVPLEVVS